MIEYILLFVLLIVVVESIVEIISESELFLPFRNKTKNVFFFGKLFLCPYCLSVWLSVSVCWVIPNILLIEPIFWYLIHVFVIHRFSNIFHSIINPLLKQKPKEKIVYNMNYKQEVENGMLREEQEDKPE